MRRATWPRGTHAGKRTAAREAVMQRLAGEAVGRPCVLRRPSGDQHGDGPCGALLVFGVWRERGHRALPPHVPLVTLGLAHRDGKGLRPVLNRDGRGVLFEVAVPLRMLR